MSRTAEEWGRLAVSLPGWRWMPGMLQWMPEPWMGSRRSIDSDYFDTGHEAFVMRGDEWPDPDDPATEGCLIRLLGPVHEAVWYTGDCDRWVVAVGEERRLYTSLGRACIAAASALGRWPGGDK